MTVNGTFAETVDNALGGTAEARLGDAWDLRNPLRDHGIGRIENMMPFIEDIARRHGVIVQPAPGGLRHAGAAGRTGAGSAGIASPASRNNGVMHSAAGMPHEP